MSGTPSREGVPSSQAPPHSPSHSQSMAVPPTGIPANVMSNQTDHAPIRDGLPPVKAYASPNIPSQFDGADDATDPATHGTRSRQRNGNARINYAEDQEMDFEKAIPATKKKAVESATTGHSAGEPKRVSGFTAINSVSNLALQTAHAVATKESTPSTPTAPATKKRKAAGSVPQPQHSSHGTPPVGAMAPTSSVVKKTGLSAASSIARETNVLTFGKHKSCLNKRGELVADDGTRLAVNGACPLCFLRKALYAKMRLLPRLRRLASAGGTCINW